LPQSTLAGAAGGLAGRATAAMGARAAPSGTVSLGHKAGQAITELGQAVATGAAREPGLPVLSFGPGPSFGLGALLTISYFSN
jgi:hypothetical protein